MLNLVNKLFGSSGSRLSKSYTKTVEIINRLENNLKLKPLYNQLVSDIIEEKISFYG